MYASATTAKAEAEHEASETTGYAQTQASPVEKESCQGAQQRKCQRTCPLRTDRAARLRALRATGAPSWLCVGGLASGRARDPLRRRDAQTEMAPRFPSPRRGRGLGWGRLNAYTVPSSPAALGTPPG